MCGTSNENEQKHGCMNNIKYFHKSVKHMVLVNLVGTAVLRSRAIPCVVGYPVIGGPGGF